jgi:hypothetical protein
MLTAMSERTLKCARPAHLQKKKIEPEAHPLQLGGSIRKVLFFIQSRELV